MPSDAESVVVFKLLGTRPLYKTGQREGATIADARDEHLATATASCPRFPFFGIPDGQLKAGVVRYFLLHD